VDAGTQLDAARQVLGADLLALWVAYFALGGTATPREIEAYLSGEGTLDPVQHDVLAHAINERYAEAGMDHPAPYAEDVADNGGEGRSEL
jgi:hypothetical protein